MPRHYPKALDYPFLFLLAGLQSLNYQIFILPNAFAPAGINGLATMVQYLFHFSIGYMSLIINIPLALFVYFTVDRRFAVKSLLFSLSFSLFTLLFQNNILDVRTLIYHTEDGKSAILAPIAAGTVNGFIYAMATRSGGCTGGTDLIASYVHKRSPEYSMIRVIFILNICVAGLSYFVYDHNIEPVILCILYCLVTSGVSDSLAKGGERAVKVEIVTDKPDEITRRLIEKLRHSVTILHAEGGFSHKEKSVLICILNPHQLPKLSDILSAFPDSFAFLSDVNKTLGNFKHISK